MSTGAKFVNVLARIVQKRLDRWYNDRWYNDRWYNDRWYNDRWYNDRLAHQARCEFGLKALVR